LRRARDRYGLEGVSFSGGEPFLQAAALARLARGCRRLGLSVLAWSGFTLEELRGASAPSGAAALLDELDVLIDGPFVRELSGEDCLRGSSNQRVIQLTDRYGEADLRGPRRVEWLVQPGGTRVIGVADYEEIAAALKLLGT
jgi:anaerobic ribonucleoside-triphosphate reductase activating protein